MNSDRAQGWSLEALEPPQHLRFLQCALDALDDAVVVARTERLDDQWNPVLVFVNAAFSRLTGYAPSDVVGRPVLDWSRAIPQNNDAYAKLRACLARGEATRVERLVLTKSGGELWIDVSVCPIATDDDDHATYFVASARDVTARRQMEGVLRESQERLHEAQQLAHIGSWEWQVAANRVTWSDELYRIYGLEPQALKPTYEGYLDRVHPEDRHLVEAAVARTLETLEPFAHDNRIVLPDGSIRWIHSRARAVVDATGKPARLLGTCQDITERRDESEGLRRRAFHDPLTGLANRALLLDRLHHAIRLAERGQVAPAVLFVDVDWFKTVNDRFGHATGDRVLVAVADRLLRWVRAGDSLARLGGDEFVVVCEQLESEGEAVELAERLVRGFDEPLALDAELTLSLSVSVGVAMAYPPVSPEVALNRADSALYLAKRNGRARVERLRGDPPG